MQSNVDDLVVDVKEGDILAGKYRVDRVLGIGGMGVVVQATHTVLQDRVALKFLLPELLENEATSARFLREAQAAVRIKSPHVARVTDVGTLDNGAPYMVMEFLEGQDLGSLLDLEGPLGVETAVVFALQACEAVAAAHANGIIHRDIKPANLFLTQGPDQRPVLKVLDFGISKVANRDGVGSLTQTHTAMGSPLYMSPEQMRSAKTVDSRTDIWSLGIVLYEMLTGTLPFVADTMPQLCALILETEPPSLETAVPDLPDGLDEVVLKALSRNPDERYQDLGEFALAIAPYAGPAGAESASRVVRILQAVGLGSNSGDGPVSIAPRSMTPSVSANTSTSFGTTDSGSIKATPRRWIYGVAAGGIAIISLSAAWAIYRISSPDTSEPDLASSVEAEASAETDDSGPVAADEAETDASALEVHAVEPSARADESAAPPPTAPEQPPEVPATATAKPTRTHRPSRPTPPEPKEPEPIDPSSLLDDRE